MLGAASEDQFGSSVSIAVDGKNVDVGTPCNDNNEYQSGRERIFTYSSVTNK